MQTASSFQIMLAAVITAGALAVGAQPPAPPPPAVAYITAAPRDLPVSFDFVGVTEASRVVEIRARVTGFLDSRDFEEGALVEKGTRLYLIDPKPFEADVQIAKAMVAQAQARLNLADQEVARMTAVTVPGAIAASDFDKQKAEQTNAAAALNLAKAELAKAELELGYTTVAAPLTGYVGKALKEIGSVVDQAANGLLTIMQQVDPIYVSYHMTERDYLQWRKLADDGVMALDGTSKPYLEITLLDRSTYPAHGAIDFESTAVDTQTGSLELRATFENRDHQLKPGQFVRAHMRGYIRPGALAVPQRAVSESPQGSYIYVLKDDNTVEQRTIEPGPWSGSDWVIESGLNPGEKVVVDGLTKLRPGAAVTPSPFGDKPDAAPAAGE